MKKNFSVLLLIMGALIFSSSIINNFETAKKINQAKWLIGNWESNFPKGTLKEQWQIKNDSIFLGVSYFIMAKDTVSAEKISLEQKGQDLFYTPIVKNQNDGKAVSFKLTSITTKQMIFENLAHDFPQKISYQQMPNDSLLAVISGTVNGKLKMQKFPMKRVK